MVKYIKIIKNGLVYRGKGEDIRVVKTGQVFKLNVVRDAPHFYDGSSVFEFEDIYFKYINSVEYQLEKLKE